MRPHYTLTGRNQFTRFTHTDEHGREQLIAEFWSTTQARRYATAQGFTVEALTHDDGTPALTWHHPAPGPLFEAINLDALSNDAPDYDEAAKVLGQYAAYCDMKARAVRLRAIGDVEAAQAHERNAEAIYSRLPQWAKW
ncbi:MAG TPA: hypothetical protein VM529_24870 [Gemmata sp.]|jgi:hypothetical protein|nr:hypothetical protein [Gemmata sp.]